MRKSVSSKYPFQEETYIDKDEHELWLEEAELNDIVDVEDIPACNVRFAALVKEISKCNERCLH